MIEILKNEFISFALIAFVIILLAFMTKRRESDFEKFDKDEKENKEI